MKLPLRNTPDAYGLVAQFLHWVVVAGIAAQFVWSWRIDEAESIRREFALVNEHKSIGMTVLALVIARLVWRAFNAPPRLPAGMPRWQRRAAAWNHRLLYALVLAMPLTGWAYTSAAGFGAEFFGLLDIPGIAPSGERLETVLGGVHRWLSRALLALVGLHVLAALRHHFWLGDRILKRMLPTWN